MKQLKLYKILVLAMMLATVVSIAFFIFTAKDQPNTGNNPNTNKKKTSYRYARPFQNITDFRYDGHDGSNRLVSISCRNLTIRRKKTGFVRFALIKEAILENGSIKLYLPPDTKKKSGVKDSARLDTADIQKALGHIISKESNLLSTFKNISSIIVHPVQLEFYQNKQIATSISAASCSIGLSHRKIIFENNVIVISRERKLMLDRLELNPENSLLAGTNFVLSTPKGKTAGKSIITDLTLQKGYE